MTAHLDKQENSDKKYTKEKRGGIRGPFVRRFLAVSLAAVSLLLTACQSQESQDSQEKQVGQASETVSVSAEQILAEEIPEYEGEPYVEIDDGEPDFASSELTTQSYETYGELDELGRCQEAEACVGTDLMPTEERGRIGQVKPSGWHTVKYENVDGKYLYNRCHLIGYQLTAENANEKNLITGTRYMNTEGMLPFENEVADYVRETENHVMYRVTPVFEGDNLVASGVWMEAESVEDDGEGVSFNVYVYNVQPGIEIDYSQGDSREATEDAGRAAVEANDSDKNGDNRDANQEQTYIINENTDKFHEPDCSSVSDIKARNKKEFTGTREELLERGYEPCGRCRP